MSLSRTRAGHAFAAGTAAVLLAALCTSAAASTPEAQPSGPVVAVDSSAGVAAQRARPNIVVIMVDDMREDDLRYLPWTQRLIGDAGVRFVNSFAPYPLCCPSRASFLLGQYAHNHKVWSHGEPWGFPVLDDTSTLATWLQDAGYATVFLGKYLNGYGHRPAPDGSGDNSVRYVPPGWTEWRGSIDGGLPAGHPANGGTYRYFDTTLSVNGDHFDNYAGRYQTRVYGELSEWIIRRRAASGQPFFFWANYTAPHNGAPRDPDDPEPVVRDDGEVSRMGSPSVPVGVRGAFDSVIRHAPGAYGEADMTDKPAFMQSAPPMNEAEEAALLEVARQRAEALLVVDRQVRRTVAALDASGELDNTLLVFTSDNGYFLGEHRIRQGKILPYDPALRVPLLMAGPGIPAGEVRYDPYLTIDMAPTLATLAGAMPGGETQIDGQSMLRVARRGDLGWTRAVLTETGPGGTVRETDESGVPLNPTDPGERDIRYTIGVRTDRYLYTDNAAGELELYDLAVDPLQLTNQVNNPEYGLVRVELAETLRKVRACDGSACRTPLPPGLATEPGAPAG